MLLDVQNFIDFAWPSFIANEITCLMPTNIFLFCPFGGIYIRFHSSTVEAMTLLKIANVDFVFLQFFQVLHSKVIPLDMPLGVTVDSQK